MNKVLVLILILIFIFAGSSSVFGDNSSNSNSNLPVIYITCDNFISESTDKLMLNSINKAIDGSATVIIDPYSPNPGEAPRAIKNAPNGTAAYIAAADPGSMVDLVEGVHDGYLKTYVQKLNSIVFVNYGNINLENTSYLPRSYDDNYSSPYFAGLYSPSTFLNDAGIDLIQPNIGTSSQKEEINKIASGLVSVSQSSNKKFLNTGYNSALIGVHQINPAKVAYGSQSILNDETPDMGYSKWMYLVSQYVSGYPIENNTQTFSKSKIADDSTYFGVLIIDEYREVGKTTADYMESNNTVPKFIKVDGTTFSQSDLQYIFARLTYDHTSRQNMTFPKYIFVNKSNEPFNIIIKYIRSSFYQIFG